MLYSVEIGKNIVCLRKELMLSQEELSFRANVSVSRLRDIEYGRANFTIDTLECIADALKVPLPSLFLLHLDDNAILELIHTSEAQLLTV